MNLNDLWALQNWVFLAGVLHFCQLPAMMMAPGMLGWKEDLAKLTEINRKIVKVIGLAIMLTVVGTGIVIACSAADLVGHSRLAIGMCGFMTVFWAYRGTVQVFLYRKIWVKGWLGNLSNYGLAFLFTFLTVVYAVAFVADLRG